MLPDGDDLVPCPVCKDREMGSTARMCHTCLQQEMIDDDGEEAYYRWADWFNAQFSDPSGESGGSDAIRD